MNEMVGTAVRLCALSELAPGQMKGFKIGERDVIVLWPSEGTPKAYDGLCPHQQLPLADGHFNGTVLVCAAHKWTFDAATGACIRPGRCRLAEYPLRIEGGDVMIEIVG